MSPFGHVRDLIKFTEDGNFLDDPVDAPGPFKGTAEYMHIYARIKIAGRIRWAWTETVISRVAQPFKPTRDTSRKSITALSKIKIKHNKKNYKRTLREMER